MPCAGRHGQYARNGIGARVGQLRRESLSADADVGSCIRQDHSTSPALIFPRVSIRGIDFFMYTSSDQQRLKTRRAAATPSRTREALRPTDGPGPGRPRCRTPAALPRLCRPARTGRRPRARFPARPAGHDAAAARTAWRALCRSRAAGRRAASVSHAARMAAA